LYHTSLVAVTAGLYSYISQLNDTGFDFELCVLKQLVKALEMDSTQLKTDMVVVRANI